MSKPPEISPERYAIAYDEKTGKLLETTITNGDYTLVLDSDGKQKSLTYSAQFQAYVAEQEAKARRAAEQRQQQQRRSKPRADGQFAPKGAKIISRTETVEGAKKGKSSVKNGEQKVLINGKTVIVKTKLADAKNALDKSAVRKITEVYEITDKAGKVHRIRETRRVDADGNLLFRQLVDNFRIDKKTKARLVYTFDADNHLTRLGEKYTTKIKGGKHIVKFLSTKFDDSGNPLDRRKTSDKIVKSGFFNSTFGKILGIALVVVATAINPALGAIVQFGVSLAQGSSLLEAFISAAAVYIGAKFGPGIGDKIGTFLSKIPILNTILSAGQGVLSSLGKVIGGAINTALKPVGQVIGQTFSQVFTRAATQEFLTKVTQQFALRVGTEVFAEQFGRKLGIFGTVATIAVLGSIGTATLSSALGSPIAPGKFGGLFADSIFSGSIQGGIAEALKNERGLGAQFLNIFSSSVAANTSLTGVAKAFEMSKFFDPTTQVGKTNNEFVQMLEAAKFKRPDRFVYDSNGIIESAEYDVYGKTVRVGTSVLEGSTVSRSTSKQLTINFSNTNTVAAETAIREASQTGLKAAQKAAVQTVHEIANSVVPEAASVAARQGSSFLAKAVVGLGVAAEFVLLPLSVASFVLSFDGGLSTQAQFSPAELAHQAAQVSIIHGVTQKYLSGQALTDAELMIVASSGIGSTNDIQLRPYLNTPTTSSDLLSYRGDSIGFNQKPILQYTAKSPTTETLSYDINDWGKYGLPSDGYFSKTIPKSDAFELMSGGKIDLFGDSGLGFIGNAGELTGITKSTDLKNAMRVNYSPDYLLEFQLKDTSKLQNVLSYDDPLWKYGGKTGAGLDEFNYPGLISNDILNWRLRKLDK